MHWRGGWAYGESLAVRLGFRSVKACRRFHAWNPEVFQSGIWVQLDPHMNWWNMMEITFGATAGAVIGLGNLVEQ